MDNRFTTHQAPKYSNDGYPPKDSPHNVGDEPASQQDFREMQPEEVTVQLPTETLDATLGSSFPNQEQAANKDGLTEERSLGDAEESGEKELTPAQEVLLSFYRDYYCPPSYQDFLNTGDVYSDDAFQRNFYLRVGISYNEALRKNNENPQDFENRLQTTGRNKQKAASEAVQNDSPFSKELNNLANHYYELIQDTYVKNTDFRPPYSGNSLERLFATVVNNLVDKSDTTLHEDFDYEIRKNLNEIARIVRNMSYCVE